MRVIVVLQLALASPASLAGHAHAQAVPAETHLSAARVVLQPCTREGPTPADSTWLPDSASATRLMRLLEPALKLQAPDAAGKGPMALNGYIADVVGFFRHGRPWIYASFSDTAQRRHRARGWVRWCDGGWSFFGVEYDKLADSLGAVRANAVVQVDVR